MTPRQLKLYNYLLKNADKWNSRVEILEAMREDYGYKGEKILQNSSSARELTRDINELKKEDNAIKIIASNTAKGIKIATKEEAVESLEKKMNQALKELKLCWSIKRKMEADGQIMLNNDKFKVIEAYR